MTMTSPFSSHAPAWHVPTSDSPAAAAMQPANPASVEQAGSNPAAAQTSEPGLGSYELLPTAAKVALLSAAKDGLLQILAREKVKLIELNTDAHEPVQARSVFGTVNYQPAKEQNTVDDEALLAHVQDDPELAQHIQTVQIVPDWVRSMLIESATHQGDGVYTLDDGTVVTYLSPNAPKAPQVAYPASKQQRATKQAAEEALQSVLDALATQVAASTRQES